MAAAAAASIISGILGGGTGLVGSIVSGIQRKRFMNEANSQLRQALELIDSLPIPEAEKIAAIYDAVGEFQPELMKELAPERPEAVEAQLDALSPLAVLSRGYALAWKLPERTLVRDAGQLARADRVILKFGRGSATAAVESIEEEANG